MHSLDALTLAGLLRIGIPITWPEAVAVVLEVADQVRSAHGTLVTPDLEHLSFSSDGRLTILPGSPIATNPVRQAAQLLRQLIGGGSAPAELRQLVEQNDRPVPACAWIEEFTTALAYFERPDRRQIIAELAQRADGFQSRIAPVGTAPPASDSAPTAGGFASLWRRWFRP